MTWLSHELKVEMVLHFAVRMQWLSAKEKVFPSSFSFKTTIGSCEFTSIPTLTIFTSNILRFLKDNFLLSYPKTHPFWSYTQTHAKDLELGSDYVSIPEVRL